MQFKPLALLAAGALAALATGGCAKSSDQSSTATDGASAAPVAPAASTAAQPDAAHGKTIFASKCAGCHGQTGTEGGIGPSLKNEKSRKPYAQAVAWIKDPQPPMAKLYPDQLSAKDVADVAAYVESL
jgi:mono/diheme cytochrome c family protein